MKRGVRGIFYASAISRGFMYGIRVKFWDLP